MDGQPGQDDGEGAGRDRDPEPTPPASGGQVPDPARSGPDPRLAQFAWDDSREGPAPSGRMALLVDDLSGLERRCPGATGDELVGLLRAWAAIESWAAGAKLGLIREMMRREAPPSPGSDHGDLPETWSRSLRYELAGALACSTQSAESTASLAWELGARLPRIAARLDDGTLTSPKARAVAEILTQLTDPDAAAAEALIADQLAGKTFTQVMRLTEQAALTVDPGMAERWREHAQKTDARVTFFREQAGTAGLSGRDLPPDEALAAMANVNARAEEYEESGAFGDTPMDVLRAQGYLDLINGVPAAKRIAAAEQQDDLTDSADAWAAAHAGSEQAEPATGDAHGDPDAPANPGDCPCSECDGSCVTHEDDDLDGSGQADDDDDDDDPGDDGRPDDGGDGGEPGPARASGSGFRRRWRRPRPRRFRRFRRSGSSARRAADRAGARAAPGRSDRAAGDAARAGRAAGRAPRLRPARPGAGPGPGRRRSGKPAHRGLRDRHQPRGIRHRPRLRPPGPDITPGRLGSIPGRTPRSAEPDHPRRHPPQPLQPPRQSHRPLVFHPAHPARQTRNPRRLRHLDARPAGRARAHRAPGPGTGLRM